MVRSILINIDLFLSRDFISNFGMVITLKYQICLLPMKMFSVEKEVTQLKYSVMILRYGLMISVFKVTVYIELQAIKA
jgi:hypothetical protein